MSSRPMLFLSVVNQSIYQWFGKSWVFIICTHTHAQTHTHAYIFWATVLLSLCAGMIQWYHCLSRKIRFHRTPGNSWNPMQLNSPKSMQRMLILEKEISISLILLRTHSQESEKRFQQLLRIFSNLSKMEKIKEKIKKFPWKKVKN